MEPMETRSYSSHPSGQPSRHGVSRRFSDRSRNGQRGTSYNSKISACSTRTKLITIPTETGHILFPPYHHPRDKRVFLTLKEDSVVGYICADLSLWTCRLLRRVWPSFKARIIDFGLEPNSGGPIRARDVLQPRENSAGPLPWRKWSPEGFEVGIRGPEG